MDPRFQPLLDRLNALANPAHTAGMAHYGIETENALGISVTTLRELARGIKSHELAIQLWNTGIHEAQMIASMVDDHKQVTPDQMESWVSDFDSWDICDGVCGNLFSKTPYAREKAIAWCSREEEFVRRAGFAMIAWLAVHQKQASDDYFLDFLPLIAKGAEDDRNFVKKAVNWALRQIGKRSPGCWQASMDLCLKLADHPSRSVQWVVKDARKELELKRDAIFSKDK